METSSHFLRVGPAASGIPRRIRKNERLFRSGQPFSVLYRVQVGTFKLSVSLDDGLEQVIAFPIAGDLVGLEALASGVHGVTATALEDSVVCPAQTQEPGAAGVDDADTQASLLRLASEALARQIRLLRLLVHGHPDARVAAFLLQWSARLRERGWSGSEFELRMSRRDIGSCLGLAPETVSRTLSLFVQRGWLRVGRRRIRILDSQALETLSHSGSARRLRQPRLLEGQQAESSAWPLATPAGPHANPAEAAPWPSWTTPPALPC